MSLLNRTCVTCGAQYKQGQKFVEENPNKPSLCEGCFNEWETEMDSINGKIKYAISSKWIKEHEVEAFKEYLNSTPAEIVYLSTIKSLVDSFYEDKGAK